MSLILEALKKSEQQRQREKAPSLQSIHQAANVVSRPSKQPWWLLVVFIVICNFAFFSYWFWRQQNPVVPPVQSPAATQSLSTQAASTSQPPATAPASATAQTSASSVVATNPQQGSGSIQTQNPAPEFTQISPRGTVPQSAPVESAPRIHEIHELPESVRNNLPAMTFSFHVYSENPEQRTIIINDRRVREGEEVTPGLRLQSITQDGVILLFEQHRVHISVLSDW